MTFSDTAAGPCPAVPVSPAPARPNPFDPRNPRATGYDPTSAGFVAARSTAAADPLLRTAFRAELRREVARFQAWRERYRRAGSGGCGSGGGPGPFEPADPGELLARAGRAVARRLAHQVSVPGRLAAALAETEAAAEALRAAVSEARSAIDRQDGSAARRAAAASALAGRARATAARLQRAASRSPAAGKSGQAEQGDAFWRFTREICAPPSEAFLSSAAFREG